MRTRRLISNRKHTVFVVTPGLLLVFKPRGHSEDAHAHPHRQRLRVLRGELMVHVGEKTIVLRAKSRPLTLAANRVHATRAVEDCWLLAEALPTVRRRA